MATDETVARYRQVLAWRAEGLTYRAIGERLGVGTGRAAHLHRAALRWQQRLAVVTPPTASRPRTADPPLTADMPLDALPITARAKVALRQRGLRTIGRVASLSDRELLGIRDVGPLTVAAIRTALATMERPDI